MKKLTQLVVRGLLLCGSVLFALQVEAGATTASCYSKAKSISPKASQQAVKATLVDEYDADWKENTGSAVYYLKASLKKGYSYTFWTEGASEEASLSVDVTAVRDEAYTGFSIDTAKDGYNAYGQLLGEDWDEDDKSTESFYIVIMGDEIGQSFTFYYQQGAVADNSGILGSVEKPQTISVGENEAKLTGTVLADTSTYYYQTGSLNAGEKYYFAIKSSDTNSVASLSFDPAEDSEAEFEYNEVASTDEDETCYEVVMTASGSIYVVAENADDASYTLRYWKLGAAKPAAHTLTKDLVQKENNREVALSGEVVVEDCQPLYRNNTDVTHKFDAVIDQALYRVKLAKNTQYRFRVAGDALAQTNVTMEVYDANGKVVAPTEGDDNTDANEADYSEDGKRVTLYYTAAADAYYWVGICQTHLDDATGENDTEILPADITCTFSAMPVSDSADPKDDVATGATALTFKSTEQTLTGRTLCGTDFADWYKFTAKAGTYYSIGFSTNSVVKEGVSLALYKGNARGVLDVDENNMPTNDAIKVASDKIVFAAETATYYVCAMRGLDSEETETAYGLTYRSTNVGQVQLNGSAVRGTDYTAVTVRSNAGSTTIRVRRTAKEGRVRVRYSTHEDTAIAGEYYVAQSGELEWADGDNKDKTVEIPIIPELNNLYRGNTQFAFELTALPTEELDDDEWPVSLGTPSRAVITIQDANKATPGKVGFVAADGYAFATPTRPTATVAAGNELELTLERTGGANGAVGVQVTATAGTAKIGTDFEQIATESQKIYWADGEAGEKTVTINTLPKDAYAADKAFTVKITALSASKTETNVTQRATLGASSVAVTLRDANVKQSSAEYVKALGTKPVVKVTPGTATAWYESNDGELTTAEIAPGKKGDLSLTVTGPGKLEFEPLLDGEATVKVTVGRTVYTSLDELAEAMPLYLGKGSQTIRFEATVAKTSEEGATLSFLNQSDDIDNPVYFAWTPLTLATCAYPVNNAGVVSLDNDTATLAWDGDNLDADGLPTFGYNVYFGDSQKNLEFMKSTEDNSIEIVTTELEPNKTYYWRVDSTFDDELSNTNTVWSFKTVEATPMITISGALIANETSAYSAAEQSEVEPITLFQGVAASFDLGLVDTNGFAAVTYAVANGRLPDGLKLDTKNAKITGTPTKVGSYTATLQAKSGRLTGATLTLAFEVEDAGLAVGTFTGLGELAEGGDDTKPQEGIASVTVTTTATGALTAKAIVAGTTYSFRATGFSDIDEDAAYVAANFEATAKFGKETVTNELSVTLPYGSIDSESWADYNGFAPLAEFEMTIHAANADRTTCTTNNYEGTLLRDSMKLPAVAAEAANWTGYYTVSLPSDADDGQPQGAGYVTVTIDARGSARVAGQLADGTAISGSAVIGFDPEEVDVEGGAEAVLIPVFYARNKTAFGGWLHLVRGENGTVYADGDYTLVWHEGDAAKTYDGLEGYSLELTPVGGWFDKLMQLYTYYLDKKVTVNVELDDGNLKEEAYPAGYSTFAWWPALSENPVEVSFAGNKMSVPRRTLVKQEGSRTLNDYEASTNICNVTLAFTRATGIFSGSLGLWFEGENERTGVVTQRELTGLRYQGVLTPVKEEGSFYVDEPGMGYLLVPTKITEDRKTRTWNASYFFGLQADLADDPDEEFDTDDGEAEEDEEENDSF